MAYRDYIHCADCDCKLIYDGDDNAREWLEECCGDPSAGTWTAEIVCPDCLKKLRDKSAAAPKVEQEPIPQEWRDAVEKAIDAIRIQDNQLLERHERKNIADEALDTLRELVKE